MKEWRSKYGRIRESEIIYYLTENGTQSIYRYYIVGSSYYMIEDNKIYMEMMEDDNMAASIVQYLKYKKINVIDSYEELEKLINRQSGIDE